jgi:hypothetical protein
VSLISQLHLVPMFTLSGTILPLLLYAFMVRAEASVPVHMERTPCDCYTRRVCGRVKTWPIEQLSPFGHSDTATLTELKGI